MLKAAQKEELTTVAVVAVVTVVVVAVVLASAASVLSIPFVVVVVVVNSIVAFKPIFVRAGTYTVVVIPAHLPQKKLF